MVRWCVSTLECITDRTLLHQSVRDLRVLRNVIVILIITMGLRYSQMVSDIIVSLQNTVDLSIIFLPQDVSELSISDQNGLLNLSSFPPLLSRVYVKFFRYYALHTNVVAAPRWVIYLQIPSEFWTRTPVFPSSQLGFSTSTGGTASTQATSTPASSTKVAISTQKAWCLFS